MSTLTRCLLYSPYYKIGFRTNIVRFISMSLRERAYLSLKFYNRPIAVGIPAFLFFFFLLYSFPFFLLLITVRTDIDSYLCGLGFLLIFLFLFLFCLATKIQHTKCQFRDWIIHWDFVTFICSFHPFIVEPRNRERRKKKFNFTFLQNL